MKTTLPPIIALSCTPAGAAGPYVEAFNACAILPGHALVQVRGGLAALVEAWLRHHSRSSSGTLFEQIERLAPLLGLDTPTTQKFHDLRTAGNLAAHPEQRRGMLPTRSEARDALFGLHVLLSLFAERVGGVPLAAIPHFVEPPEVHWGDVCERAIFERDAAAMLAVGRRHCSEAVAANSEAERRAKAEQSSGWFVGHAGFRYSLDWFQRAMLNTADHEVRRQARFEQARILIQVLPKHERAGEAMDLLRWSAEDGVADAQSLLAHLILDPRSSLPEPRDLTEARDWAEQAATAEHPEALNLLTAIYGNGRGVERDPLRAIAYARRASQAGYPLAHANLALLLLDQPAEGRDDDEIRAAIDRAKLAGVGHGHWAECRLLDDQGLTESSEAADALRAAAKAQVVPALLVSAQQAMCAEPPDWDLGRIAGWLIDVLRSRDADDERVDARDMLAKVRDEGLRRMRTAPDPGQAGDDLLMFVLQSGACLDIQPGESASQRSVAVVAALSRTFSPVPKGQPATREDVELLLRAIPDLPVRWTGTEAEVFTGAAAVRAMREEAPTQRLEHPNPPPVPRVPTRRPSRNGPCPCGSGRKLKRCCGRG